MSLSALLSRSSVRLCGVALLAAPALAHAQTGFSDLAGDATQGVEGVGWAGFLDVGFMVHTLLALTLASVLGALLAYHPRIRAGVDTIDEAEAPKVAVLYAAASAIIGIMVVKYGLVVGFVVFGMGGLFRFRTALSSATGTGQLILITMVGLACGLDLPHLGVLATVFGYGLTYVTTQTTTHAVTVDSIGRSGMMDSAAAYRALIERHGGTVIREHRLPDKHRVRFVIRAPHRLDRGALEDAFETEIPEKVRGTVDWAVE